MTGVSRRDFLKSATVAAAAAGIFPADACARMSSVSHTTAPSGEDERRLHAWISQVRASGDVMRGRPLGWTSASVGELAIGTPYEAFTLEQYLKDGGDPTRLEPLTVSLTRFDCVTLVESCLAVARVARSNGQPQWNAFAHEIERMRYRGGARRGFTSRLHYFSEWIADGEKRGLVRDLGRELGGVRDSRPLRFMTEHRASYPGLKNDSVFEAIRKMEIGLDSTPRFVVPTEKIESVADKIQHGDVLAFATSIPGLDVTHAAMAYRENGSGTLRVLHAPLSGGSVEISKRTLFDYVTAIKRSTGILVARPIG